MTLSPNRSKPSRCICLECKKNFIYEWYNSGGRINYCSDECYKKYRCARRNRLYGSRWLRPTYKPKERKRYKCQGCGKDGYSSQVRLYCSPECRKLCKGNTGIMVPFVCDICWARGFGTKQKKRCAGECKREYIRAFMKERYQRIKKSLSTTTNDG